MRPFLPARVLLLVLLCGWSANNTAFAQENASSQQQTYTVRGSIVNKAKEQAIERALVTIQGQVSNVVFTDSEGRFEFDDVPAGTYMVTALRPGFAGYSRFSSSSLHRIQVGPNMKDFSISLLPTGTITGQITLSTSDSAEDIQVHLLRRAIRNGRAEWEQAEVRRTNSDGIYVFGNLSPGQYRVYTSGSVDPAPGPLQNEQRWGFAPAYYSADGASAIHLRPGQEAHADMMLNHELFYPVTVSVTNGTQSGVSVQVYDEDGHPLPIPSRYDSREGVAHLNLPKGRYILEGQTFGSTQMFGSREITVQNGPLNVALSLVPLNPVPVIIRREFTEQNNGTGFGIVGGGPSDMVSAGVNLMLHKTTGGPGFFGGNLRRAPGSSDNSSFQIEGVRPGSYWVQAMAFQGYVASITSGGVDLTKNPLVVGPGGTSSPIEIVLRNDMASLKVMLSQAASAEGNDASAYVSIVPMFDTAWQEMGHMPLPQTGMNLNLPPGTYRIFAFDEPQELEYKDPQAMNALAGKGQTVTLAPGGSAQVSVDVIPADSLEP
jgi:hypothetical protein